ncbi:toll/interleukin-1 receptor domain-containing protein [Shewanella sp. 202IG2-18]|uniref:TIR domain-containing protein n=1 Tax=Parashewanella hymeniacidonis TaxID=2807618 RepID=UPI001960289A|nr:TIR domain-containing protein [Parashewanella hymeniacidonis]MBM7073373.1 toll/interleukin-1 receptor domain-containing protein [Parashewanella hymeniacidonis]
MNFVVFIKGICMKVFLSWSGELSHKVALTLRDWLPSVIQSIEPYVSSEDIDKGARWSTDIASELANSSYGILCVTKENLHAPWLTFEAGALSKTMDKSFVSPFLFDIKRAEVDGPILQFQSTVFEKDDVKKLLLSLNKADSGEQLAAERLEKAFDVWYPDLENKLRQLVNQHSEHESTNEQDQEIQSSKILEEILDLSRDNQKLLRSPNPNIQEAIYHLKDTVGKVVMHYENEAFPNIRKRKSFHPSVLEELFHLSPIFHKNLTGFQVALSLFKDEFPWIYDSGVELVKILKSGSSQEEKRQTVEEFQELIEISFEHPLMREMYSTDKQMHIMARELSHILRRNLEQYL